VIPLETIREMFDYNYWARDRQFEACEALNQEQFLRPMESSYSSLRDTLAHLVGAEWGWQERWRGRSPSREEYFRDWGPDRFPTLAAVRERWAGVELQVRDYLAHLTEEPERGDVDVPDVANALARRQPSNLPPRSGDDALPSTGRPSRAS